MKRKVKRPFDNEQFRKGYVAGMFAAEKELNTELLHFAEKAHKIMSEGTFPDYGIKINFKDSYNTITTNLDMKTEEKAKRYDEALERARMLNNGKDVDAEAGTTTCEYIFPELKESEDERIRKAIVTLIKDLQHYSTNYAGVDPTEMLAWLEKQKEASKAIEAVEKIDKYIDERLANAHDMKDYNPDKDYYRGWDDALGKMAGMLQDVYSEEKKKDNKFTPRVLPCSAAWFEDGEEKQKEPTTEELYAEAGTTEKEYIANTMKQVRAFREKQKEQKPADEQFPPLEGLDAIKAKYYDDGFKNGFDEGVESVKPAEWSEEDETCLTNTLIMLKEYAIHHYSKDDANKSVNWLENRVKSLHPQSKDEIYKEKNEAFKLGKHQLAIKFMNYLDENRPEGKMSLSNGECEDIDKAFQENDWTKIMRYAKKYLIQSEQKPAEWSEEDKAMIDDIIFSLPRMANGSIEILPSVAKSYSERIKSLKNRGNFPKSNTNSPSEWSEEDEKMRDNILRLLSCFVGTSECDSNPSLSTSYPAYQKEMDWLKSLPLNLKKKNEDVEKLCSNEWSEEDAEMYINVASSLRGYACGLENEEHKRHIKKGLDWLENRFKSLRPQSKDEIHKGGIS